jgi:hypothetical protein
MEDGPGKARALQPKIQGIAEVKVSRPVCIVRRVMVKIGRFGQTLLPCEWKKCLAAFTRKFGRFRLEKGRIFLRKHNEITRKFGRHVLTYRKVWP